MEKALNMLNLNDDCLNAIFIHLDLKDQFNMVKTCQRFENIIKDSIWRRKFQLMSRNSIPEEKFSREEYRELHGYISGFIQGLNLSRANKVPIWELNLQKGLFALDFFVSLPFPNLVKFIYWDPDLNDHHVALLAANCPNLKILWINSTNITGVYIKNLPKLRVLFAAESPLRPEHVSDILKCPNLTHLEVYGSKIRGKAFTATTLSKLRYLKLAEQTIDQEFVRELRLCSRFGRLTITLESNTLCKDYLTSMNRNEIWNSFFNHVHSRISVLGLDNLFNLNCLPWQVLAANVTNLTSLRVVYIKFSSFSFILKRLKMLPAVEMVLLYVEHPSVFETEPFINFVGQAKTLRGVQIRFNYIFLEPCLLWILDIIEVLKSEARPLPFFLRVFYKAKINMENSIRQVLQNERYTTQSSLVVKFVELSKAKIHQGFSKSVMCFDFTSTM